MRSTATFPHQNSARFSYLSFEPYVQFLATYINNLSCSQLRMFLDTQLSSPVLKYFNFRFQNISL
jgi:hypothetical protein